MLSEALYRGLSAPVVTTRSQPLSRSEAGRLSSLRDRPDPRARQVGKVLKHVPVSQREASEYTYYL